VFVTSLVNGVESAASAAPVSVSIPGNSSITRLKEMLAPMFNIHEALIDVHVVCSYKFE
jgi:hypothetical protein